VYWARPRAIYFANTRDDAARIGFDDRTIYDEFGRDHGDRKIPMIQVLREEALVAFQEWQQKNDRIPY
jgi:tRNA(Arg) A34 adenosine deaminase TadA